MKVKIMIILSLLIIYSCINASKIELDGIERGKLGLIYTIFGEDNSPLKYNEFNLLDKNLKTASAISKSNCSPEDSIPWFNIFFKKEFPVDKIVIYNGFQLNMTVYQLNDRPNEVKIDSQNESDDSTNYSFVTNIQLLDITNSQELLLNKEIRIKNFGIGVLSTYPGTKYDDICLSKLEFWYKGEKYNVANLEEAKKEYIKTYIQRCLHWILSYYYINSINPEGMDKLDKLAGIKKTVELGYDTCINFEKSGDIKVIPALEDNKVRVHVGSWKFDDEGRLWIKLDNGDWKVSKSSESNVNFGKRHFIGTDLDCVIAGWGG